MSRGPSSYCVPAGETIRLTGRREDAGLRYSSTTPISLGDPPFKWRILPPRIHSGSRSTDRSPIIDWRGSANGRQNDGLFTGGTEGLVAVEVREGNEAGGGRSSRSSPRSRSRWFARAVRLFAPSDTVDLEVRASFSDGSTPPTNPRPQLRVYRSSSSSSNRSAKLAAEAGSMARNALVRMVILARTRSF